MTSNLSLTSYHAVLCLFLQKQQLLVLAPTFVPASIIGVYYYHVLCDASMQCSLRRKNLLRSSLPPLPDGNGQALLCSAVSDDQIGGIAEQKAEKQAPYDEPGSSAASGDAE